MVVKAELFTGENLNTYFGGIGQGVNTTTLDEIQAKGGWCAATLTPYKSWTFNVGIGLDEVDKNDINAGERRRNRAIFGNAIYAINSHADVGCELSQWQTDYLNSNHADDVRFQASFRYKF